MDTIMLEVVEVILRVGAQLVVVPHPAEQVVEVEVEII
jgi:hypothetical protein